jgi:hypothetical protein
VQDAHTCAFNIDRRDKKRVRARLGILAPKTSHGGYKAEGLRKNADRRNFIARGISNALFILLLIQKL